MIKKILSIAGFLTIMAVVIMACNKKKDILTAPAYAEFATANTTTSFYVTNDANAQIKIPIGITNVANVDRKIIIKDSSRSAVAGTQYSLASTTITIPAGKAADSIVLKGIYAGYPVGRKDTLYIRIVGGDVPIQAYNTLYTVYLQGYCDVVLNDLLGDYDNSIDGYGSSKYGPYTSTVASATSTGATSAKLLITNFGSAGWGPFALTDPANDPGIVVNIDWSNPAKFTAVPANQNYFADPGNPFGTIKAGSGTFSSCANTFSFTYTVTYEGTDYVMTTSMKR